MGKTVREIVREHLKTNGYDGLYTDHCRCKSDDLFPCCDGSLECVAEYLTDCDCGETCDWHISSEKPESQ